MDLLEQAERIDGYRKKCLENTYNAAARKSQHYELDSLSPTALFYLRGAVEAVPLARPCEFIILNETADGGMPHTRPANVICLPKGLCKEAPASNEFLEMLRHEAIHVDQRAHTAEWNAVLDPIGWTPVAAETIPAEFRERCRVNPDTCMSPFWAWKRYHVPLPLFRRDPTPRSLHDCSVHWMDLRSGALHASPPTSFLQVYGSALLQSEHPYEIYAELLSKKNVTSHDEIMENLRGR